MNDAELSEHVMIRVTPIMLKAVQADAKANERTVAQTIRLAIRRYLDSLAAP